MSAAKMELFSDEQVALARFARTLGHPARIAIVAQLLKEQTLSCRQIVDALPLAQATVSQHLKALRLGGLVTCQSHGAQVRYSLASERIRDFCQEFRQALGQF